jgi:hypothetical protein
LSRFANWNLAALLSLCFDLLLLSSWPNDWLILRLHLVVFNRFPGTLRSARPFHMVVSRSDAYMVEKIPGLVPILDWFVVWRAAISFLN